MEPATLNLILQIALVFAPVIAGGVWGWFKRKDWLSDEAEKALEAGVLAAWRSQGKGMKAAIKARFDDPEDPTDSMKLSDEDQKVLRDLAKTTAKEVLSEKGLDLNKLIKSEALQDLAIKKIVDRFKK